MGAVNICNVFAEGDGDDRVRIAAKGEDVIFYETIKLEKKNYKKIN